MQTWQSYFENFGDFVIALPAVYSKPVEAISQNQSALAACVKQVQKYLITLGFDSHGVSLTMRLDTPTQAALTFAVGPNWLNMTWVAIAQQLNDEVKMKRDYAGRDLTKRTFCMKGWKQEGSICVKTAPDAADVAKYAVPAAVAIGALVYFGGRR